jgi:hypothetical protein
MATLANAPDAILAISGMTAPGTDDGEPKANGTASRTQQTPTPSPGSSTPSDEVDSELLALPEPPRRERTATSALLLLTALVSLFFAWILQEDAAFGSGAGAPTIITQADQLYENAFVELQPLLGAAESVRFEKPLREGSFRLLPVLALSKEGEGSHTSSRQIWVEVALAKGTSNFGRFRPPEAIRGRALRVDKPKALGFVGGARHADALSRAERRLADSSTNPPNNPPAERWLVIDGETPQGLAGSRAAFWICLGAAIVAIATLIRMWLPISARKPQSIVG